MNSGVLSISDQSYFPGFQILVESINREYPVALHPLSLSSSQMYWCLDHGVTLCRPPPLIFPQSELMWPTWNKPLFIKSSPFLNTIYIDADCLVLSSLSPLFTHLYSNPLLLLHPYWPTHNTLGPPWYEDGTIADRLCTVNAGVLGFNLERDTAILDEWTHNVGRCLADDELKRYSCWWDEGCLIFTLEKLKLQEKVIEKFEWNRYHNDLDYRKKCKTKEEFLSNLKYKEDDVILHFIGRPKSWENWNDHN